MFGRSMFHLLCGVSALLVFSGCDDLLGRSQREIGRSSQSKSNLPPAVLPCATQPAATYKFAISSSRTNPRAAVGNVEPGPLDLYLWFVSANRGLAAVELNVERVGAELRDPPFTPVPPNLFLTWEGSGEIDVAVASCPQGGVLLGTIHLDVVADSIFVNAIMASDHAGAVDCSPCAFLYDFTSDGFQGN